MVMECLNTILRHRLMIAKKMYPDAKLYFVVLAHSLSTSLSDRRLREMIINICPGVDVENVVREFHAMREILELEARDRHVERLDTYINVIPQYDDPAPARVRILKDML